MNDDFERPITARDRMLRRTGAVLMAIFFPLAGVVFLLLAGTSGGKGYQVAPVLSLMVGVLFGIPMVSILFRNVRAVWYETSR